MSTKDHQSYPQIVLGYNESFKMSLVAEILSGQITPTAARGKYNIGGKSTIRRWINKYGSVEGIKKLNKVRMPNEKEKNKALKTRVHQLEKLVADLELEKKALNKLIEIAEREYQISIKKNTGLKQYLNSSQQEQKGT